MSIKSTELTLILGGARSGKSREAERRLEATGTSWLYIATAELAADAEMAARVAEHRARRGKGWVTVEAPLDPGAALRDPRPALLDCLTLWLANLLHHRRDPADATAALIRALEQRDAPTVLVGCEVGLGIVPENALARRFRDAAGTMHQRLAARADRVVLMVAGLPLAVKG